ncbi:coiled-coil domain-containing protein [Collimonas humicola]|uniref:hypothetical protein n=1 Tax=Collimonas humicola TaxID=2825886 RepID=UPI001B8B4A83|nr:hypothetical protein [Collimonas humicola]
MQKISRIHLANCGFRTAWYEAVTFNLTEPGTGLPTDTIINLENGGGKTTLIGLVFSCFETSQERFLKHIQSKHSSFSQYFTHDGVPGFIVIEWLMPARSVGGHPYKLVTGQVVSVRNTTETEVDRMFFSFEERADLRLEDIPAPGLSGASATSMNEFSRWIHDNQKKHSGNVFISHNRQAEWQRHLKDERLIDLDMLRMQVNFSAQEGGFDTGFLDFKTESEFLRKFLFLTSDTGKAEEARRSVVSVCELHRRKPQLQRRRDHLKKFRISLTTFADAARHYMEAVSTQRTMLIHGAQLVQSLQARAVNHRKTQAVEATFEKEQRNQASVAAKNAALFAIEWITGTWVWHQKRVAQTKKLKDDTDTLVLGLETRSKLLKAARLQQEILSMDERIKELDALAEAERAELKPARDHVEIQGALLRRALFIEESRLKDALATLDDRSKQREQRKTALRSQKVKADADELRLTREQTGLQTTENLRNARRLVLERDGVFVNTDESADGAIVRHEAASRSHHHERDLHLATRDAARTQARQHRIDANEERVKGASIGQQAKGLQTYIAKGEAELERLGQLPALLGAVETDRVDPQSPALLPRLQDVIADSNWQKSLSDVRLAELRATRQAIEDTGVAGYSHDVALVVQGLHAVGVRSAIPFNEYIARAVDDATKAQALILSDPARYSGVCVAQAEFAKVAEMSWIARKPSRPVMVSVAALDTATVPEDRLVVPPEDASAFNIVAATRLAESLDSRLQEEDQRRAAYELRYTQAIKAVQELETFTGAYGNGQLAEAAVKQATLEGDASAARSRAANLEAEAASLDTQAEQHDKTAAEAESRRSESVQATQAARQFQTEHESGREGCLARLAEISLELTETQERKVEIDSASEKLQEVHDADQTQRADANAELRQVGEERGRIAYYNREYPAQERLQQHPRPLTTLRQLYEDAQANYLTEEKARLGSLSERIQGVKEQRLGKTKEFTRDFSGVNMADLKPYLSLNHEAELSKTEWQLVEARKEQVEASGKHQSLSTESRTWHASNKQSIGTATSEFERYTAEELGLLLEDLKQKIDKENDRMRVATEEANRASSRAQEKLREAESDEQNESILRSGMGLPDQPDPALIAAEIGALMGETPEVPDPTSVLLELNSGKQVSALLAEYNGKNAGVSKLQTGARTSFDELKSAAGDPTFREVDPDVALQMLQNDFTAACTDASRLLEHLDDRISTTESTLTGMQADFDTCVEEVLGVVRGAINTLNKACSQEKCIPVTAPYVGGKQVLKMRANFAAVTLDMRRAAMRNYLDVLADTLAIPAKGTDLIADAVARIYGKPLGLHVLKMSIEESEQYVPVEKISNSGGEGVVMAMFLYLVINQLRAENHAQVQRNAGGPLILDNPFAKATTAALWRAQRLLASAMNVQLIFATALQDFNSIGEFQRFIRLRKAGQNTKTKRWHLEVANLQLNEAADEAAA